MLPHGNGDLPTMMTTMGGRRGRGGGMTTTANGNDSKYDNKHGYDDNEGCGSLPLLFVWERYLLLVTPATTDFGIICPHVLL